MRRACGGALAFSVLGICFVAAADRPAAPSAHDSRLGRPKDYNGYFPWSPPSSKEAWEARRKEVREQVLVATGLWPMPEKTPLHPVIHGKIERDGYTVEKVFFASYPGHYVSGSLYRPTGKTGKLPGVLCPHGHWPNGRFYDRTDYRGRRAACASTVALAGSLAGKGPYLAASALTPGRFDREARAQMDKAAEKTLEGALYPLQARCAQLARMGCVVFHYDMVGQADSQQIGHREGFTDTEAELRLQSFMGLQTYNSIRSLDFLLSLPDVDASRIGVTGASGGGTQTFMLGAVDDRPTVAFPAVMVSTAMQGGCICENCSYLRIGTGNIELAGLFAPKPLAMSGANDWTIDIERKGLPELKALYKLYGAEDRVMARCFPQFEHNYNQVSREVMYNWFNKYLHLGQPTPVREKPFVPIPPRELSVFDAEHPRPKDAVDARGLRRYLTEESEKQMAALAPNDAKTLHEFRRVVGTALHVMVADRLPTPADVESRQVGTEEKGKVRVQKLVLGRKGQGEQVPATLLSPPAANGTVVVWVHPVGKSSVFNGDQQTKAARSLLEKNASILALDVFHTGELGRDAPVEVNKQYAGYTFGYNRPLLANRVHDILTAVGYAKGLTNTKEVNLVGWEKAGPWVVLARALCGDAVGRTVADADHFRFENVQTVTDEMMLPGALKFGGLPAFAALCAPGYLFVHDGAEAGLPGLAAQAYRAAEEPGKLHYQDEKAWPETVASWLVHGSP